jgi:hypothetical protein
MMCHDCDLIAPARCLRGDAPAMLGQHSVATVSAEPRPVLVIPVTIPSEPLDAARWMRHFPFNQD